jgi:hypothetical protein
MQKFIKFVQTLIIIICIQIPATEPPSRDDRGIDSITVGDGTDSTVELSDGHSRPSESVLIEKDV